jgi:Family of unknown function (DUF5681)
MNAPYTVGCRKPPIKYQFKKGQSGNPTGRPRKRPRYAPKEPLDFQKSLIAELGSQITITEAGRTKKISKLEALVKSLVARALQHDKSALKEVVAQIAKFPKDAFVDNGNEVYTFRITAAQMQAREDFLRLAAEYSQLLDDDGPPVASSNNITKEGQS